MQRNRQEAKVRSRAVTRRLAAKKLARATVVLVASAWAATLWPRLPALGQDNEEATIFSELMPQAQKSREVRIRALHRLQDRILAMKRELAAARNAYQKRDHDDMVEKINEQLRVTTAIARSLPVYRGAGHGDQFDRDLREYLKRSRSDQARLNQIRHSIDNVYKKELGAAMTTGGTTGGAASGGSGGLEVYIVRKSGDMVFYINGRKVERARQAFNLHGARQFTLRAMAMGAKRRSIEEFTAPSRTTLLESNPYRLHYETAYGNFKGSTDWWVQSEKYFWSVTKSPRTAAQFDYSPSGKNRAVANDLVTFRFEKPFSFAANVRAETQWKATSQRPGGVRSMQQTDKSAGSIELSVSGRWKD